MLRPGNAGSNDAADHVVVLAAALAQLPRVGYRKLMVRIDGAGATHALVGHLEALNTAIRRVVYTVGWTITSADEGAIAKLPEAAWTVALGQDGQSTPGYEVAELTDVNTRSGWPKGLRLIVRRCHPSRRQAKKLTDFERSTGWVYSIIATNIGFKGLKGVRGSHTAQFLDVLHRHHAVVEDRVRCNKAMGLRNLPSQSWQVNAAWILAANLAADLDAWTRLLGCAGEAELEGAEPASIRAKLYSIGARLTRHARTRTLRLAATWPWSQAFAACWQRLAALPDPAT
ncbi:transposase [Glycomyces sp. L485]|nr:transposase [Glycomyces sp. L485]